MSAPATSSRVHPALAPSPPGASNSSTSGPHEGTEHMSDLGRALGGLLLSAAVSQPAERQRQGGDQPKRSLAEDLDTLRAASERYQRGLAFEPGQLVTPRADSGLRDAGRVHIVLDVDPDASARGERKDIRVAWTCSCDHGEVQTAWLESWMFDLWTEPATPEAAPEVPAEPAHT